MKIVYKIKFHLYKTNYLNIQNNKNKFVKILILLYQEAYKILIKIGYMKDRNIKKSEKVLQMLKRNQNNKKRKEKTKNKKFLMILEMIFKI